MFEGFANVWTPVLRGRQVGRKPVRVVVAGEALVLFRGREGKLGALLDRCPHRGVALSLGRVTSGGCLECPFHGWQFDETGANRLVPLNPDARRDVLAASALPVREVGELIWAFTAIGPQALPDLVVPEGLSASGLVRTYTERQWDCHWTRAMENMLDSAHLPFVHRRTIGRAYRRRMREGSRMAIGWDALPWGGRATPGLDGDNSGATLEFFQPNVMALTIPLPGKHLRIHALVIPAASGKTRLIVAQSRDFAKLAALNPLFALLNGVIADEDRAVVESTGPLEVPPAGSEKSVGSDRITLQFRKYYYETLRSSFA